MTDEEFTDAICRAHGDGQESAVRDVVKHLRERCMGRWDVEHLAKEIEARFLGAAPSPSQSSTPSLSTAAPGDGDPSPETEGADAQGSETGGTGQLSRRAPGSLGEREDRAAKSVRVEWEDGLYTEIRGTTARGIVQFLATMYCAPGETTDTRANVVKCVCGLTLTVACPCCGAPRGEPCKHHGSALASPSPQTHDEGDKT